MPLPPLHWILHRARTWVRYRIRAVGAYSLHSPWVFGLYNEMVKGPETNSEQQIEYERLNLLKDNTLLQIDDMGAGYGGDRLATRQKTVAQVVQSSARELHTGRWLARLVRYQQAETVLELGSNLGFSTSYLALGLAEPGQLTTVEGSAALADFARQRLMGDRRIQVCCASFDEFLAHDKQPYDVILLDGNHTYEATLRYGNILLDKLNPGGVLVLDDIYWSPGMTQAWKHLQADTRVCLSVDLYRLGLLWVGLRRARQHFILRGGGG